MIENTPQFLKFFRITFLVMGIFFTSILSAQEDLDVNKDGYTIPSNEEEIFNNVTLSDNASILTVNGTLIVQGNLVMDGNNSQFIMGDNALVIIYGNFQAHNNVNISVSSYLIVYGDFTQKTGSGNAQVEATNGNIYIFGDVDDGWENFDSCPEYEGNVSELGTEDCDYGTGKNYEDNFEQFPDKFKDAVNCYDLSDIFDKTVCEGTQATFSVAEITDAVVFYEWQEKIGDEDWVSVKPNPNTHTYTVPNTSIENNGKLYRVVVRPSENTTGCKVSISRKVTLTVEQAGIWTGVDTNWNNTANWSCNSLPTLNSDVIIPSGLTNYPTVNTGTNALSRNLNIEADAEIIVNDNWLRISGSLNNSGSLNTENGSISFEGTSAQVIPPDAFTGNRILNLRIDNAAGVTSEATIEIINSLHVATGNFATGNDLTLISNPSGTAFIDGSGGGEVTGTVTMQRYLNNGFGYKYISTPFSNSIVGDFSGFMELSDGTTNFPHFYEYNEGRKSGDTTDLTGWQAYTNSDNVLNIGEGYALNLSGVNDPVTIEISGEVNNGDVDIVLENNNGAYTKGFNLVGNPYPSPIDWGLMVPGLSGIDNAIYFFNAGSDDRYTGTYSSLVNGVSTGVNSTIIPSMQGFFVRVSNPGNTTLNFNNAARTGNLVSQNFYKAKNPRIIPQIKLAAGFSGEKTSDAAVIYFYTGATTEFEKDLDAFKLLNTATEVPSLYSLTKKQEKLSINAISSTETQEIPLGIKTEKSGKMFIELARVENIFPSAFLYLKDKKNKLVHDFSEKAVYSYTSQKGEFNDRFSLILSANKLSENELRSNLEYFSVHTAEGEILVKLNLEANTSGNVILSNISGQVLQIKSGKAKEEIKFSGITVPGVYLVSLEFENDRFSKKILIKK